MYKIYLSTPEGNLYEVYSMYPSEETHKVVSPVLDMEVNRAGSLEFSLYPNNPNYERVTGPLNEFSVREAPYNAENEIWRGRLLECRDGFYKNRQVTVEGELAYLRDIVQEPNEYEKITPKDYATALLKIYNKKAPAYARFQLGRVTVTDDHSSDKITKKVNKGSYKTSYDQDTLSCLTSLLDSVGGHMEIRHENGVRYLDILKDYENTCPQVIRFGENLLDFASSYNMADLVTVLVPIGGSVSTTDETTGKETSTNITVSSVNGGSPYVLSNTAIATYGRREKSINFSGIIQPDILLKLANKWLTDTQFDNWALEINAVDAANLSDSEEPLRYLSKVRAVSDPHGMDKLFPITKVHLTLDDPSQCIYTMSTTTKPVATMSTAITDHDKEVESMLSDLTDEVRSTLSTLTTQQITDVADWVIGDVVIGHEKDNKKYSTNLVHQEFVTHEWRVDSREWFSNEHHDMGTSDLSYDTWHNFLDPEKTDEQSCIRFYKIAEAQYSDQNDEPLTDSGVFLDYRCHGKLRLPLENGDPKTVVVYVVAKFCYGKYTGFGRPSNYSGGPVYVTGGEGGGYLMAKDSDSGEEVTRSGGIRYPVALAEGEERIIAYAQVFRPYPAVDDQTGYECRLIFSDGSFLWHSDDTSVGGLSPEGDAYYFFNKNFTIAEGVESEMYVYYVAMCQSTLGQIRMDEIDDNVRHLGQWAATGF